MSKSNVVLSDAEFSSMMDVSLLATPATKTSDAVSLTEAQKAIVESSVSKSDKIRQLLGTGLKRGDVAKILGIRYQHVRNVELTPLKRKA